MSANIFSFADSQKKKQSNETDFGHMFRKASNLRTLTQQKSDGDVVIVNWGQLTDFFQKAIADEVFRLKLFNPSILISIPYTARLITSYAKGDMGDICVTECIENYAASCRPADLLCAANSAFILFSLWPETRANRSVKYRELGLYCGPSLFISYGEITRSEFGHQMAEAFSALGNIVHDHCCI